MIIKWLMPGTGITTKRSTGIGSKTISGTITVVTPTPTGATTGVIAGIHTDSTSAAPRTMAAEADSTGINIGIADLPGIKRIFSIC
jgi:hypothetical protein